MKRSTALRWAGLALTMGLTAAWGEETPPMPPPEPPSVLGPVAGESLTYNIHWMGVPGGVAEMTFTQPEPDRYAVEANLRSAGVVEALHKVRDRLYSEGWWKMSPPHALLYRKEQWEKGKTRLTLFRFNREELYAERQFKAEPLRRIEPLPPEVDDPLTAFYLMRRRENLKPGTSIQLTILDKELPYEAQIIVGASEKILTPLGWFQALPVQPTVESSDLFRHEGALTIWISDDHRRLPLQVTAKLRLGSAVADLIAFDDGRGEVKKVVIEKEAENKR
ncbi:MAG: DUF3108 domain-containing protein [Magnetococcales bacterium]|nr:DUF3108 domain-containing protein [Magnetococcales bacterium]